MIGNHIIRQPHLQYRQSVLISFYGSQYYNLNGDNSDEDYLVFTLPTLHDVSSNEYHVRSSKCENLEYNFRDIRLLINLIEQPNFIDMLYSELTYDDKRFPELNDIVDMKDKITIMNLPAFYSWAIIKCEEDFNKLKNHKPKLIEKYGYNTNGAMHSYRILDLLERFYKNDFKNLKLASYYDFNDPSRDKLLRIKYGHMKLDEYKKEFFQKFNYIEDEIKQIYLLEHIDTKTITNFRELIDQIVKKSL